MARPPVWPAYVVDAEGVGGRRAIAPWITSSGLNRRGGFREGKGSSGSWTRAAAGFFIVMPPPFYGGPPAPPSGPRAEPSAGLGRAVVDPERLIANGDELGLDGEGDVAH